jgi:hypothetical protein
LLSLIVWIVELFGNKIPANPAKRENKGRWIVAITRKRFFIETHEISVVKRRRFFVKAFCADCAKEVRMLPPSEAAFLVCQDTEEIYSLMDSKKLHFCLLSNGSPFVCLKSLSLI